MSFKSKNYDSYDEEESYDDIFESITLKKKVNNKEKSPNGSTLFNRSLNHTITKIEDVWECASDSDDDISVFDTPVSTYRPKKSRPLSERFNESMKKRNAFIAKEKELKEQNESLENTFKPQKFSHSNWEAKCEHKFRKSNSEKSKNRRNEVTMSKKSKKIVENLKQDSNTAFLMRQTDFMKAKNAHPEEVPKKKTKISPKTIERLSQPKKLIQEEYEEEEDNNKSKSYCTQDTISRMLRSYVEKNQMIAEAYQRKLAEEEVPSQSIMNDYSRELTSQIGKRDQYEESLKIREEKKRQSKEKKEFDDMSMMRDCTFQPDIRESKFYRESFFRSSDFV